MAKMKKDVRGGWVRTWKKEIDFLQKVWEPGSIKIYADLKISDLTRTKLRRADPTLSSDTLLHIYQQLLFLVEDRFGNNEEERQRVLNSLQRILRSMPPGS